MYEPHGGILIGWDYCMLLPILMLRCSFNELLVRDLEYCRDDIIHVYVLCRAKPSCAYGKGYCMWLLTVYSCGWNMHS